MPFVNFYLKKPVGKISDRLIYLQFKYNGRKLVYSFGKKINPLDWSKDNKRVKSNRQTILDGRYELNDLLDKLEKACIKAYNEELVKGIPPVSVLKFRMESFINQNMGRDGEVNFYQLFDRFISGEIKNNGIDKSANTLKNYATAKGHLTQFDIRTRYHLNFENINLDFFYEYTSFLQKEFQLKPNSIARDISVLKAVMNKAVELNYTGNIQFRHKKFSFAVEETEAVYLSEKEILQLYRYDFSLNKRLEQVRDLFVLGCSGALCFSNYQFNNPSGGTRPASNIPAYPYGSEILSKYTDNTTQLPAAPSNQKFNSYIKEVCRMAGLTEKGRLPAEPALELWECISSQTARRSMAINFYLRGAYVSDLMKITGHKTENAFFKFIRVSKLKKEND
jgi:hypothetical protein